MPVTRVSLSGNDWLFKDYYGEDWRWRDAHKPVNRDTRFWRQGTVPGSVHHDLWAAGEIPDPYVGRNSLLLEWIPARTWLYKKTFHVDERMAGHRAHLVFEGVDYAAEFYLNGELLGAHEGMYAPVAFDVSERLAYGADNLLAVVIRPAPDEQPQVSRTSLVLTHKSRMTYWWDFCPRMIHVGIWDHVWLEFTGAVRIEEVSVRPVLSPDFTHADIDVSVALEASAATEIEVYVLIRVPGDVVASSRMRYALTPGLHRVTLTCTLDDPQLWYPNGHGAQPLYEAVVRLTLPDKQNLDRRVVTFGIRQVALVPNDTADATARPYTFVVNGQKLYAKGWNWVPLDVMYGVERPEKLAHLFDLARRAHVNLLRIWGGGLIERESFYDLADQYGIMIWQEFIQSSSGIENTPSDAPAFIDLMVREAEQIIPRKRHHPSLVIWCGGNELSDASGTPLTDDHPLMAALKATVERLDPERHWLPTSPTGRVFMNSLDNIARDPTALHDVHGPWEFQGVTAQFTLYNASTSLLHSEFGVEGVTNLKTLNRTIAPEHQQPPTLDNPIWAHLGAWWNQQAMWRQVFGDIADLPTLVRATQMMQAVGLAYAVEADRRRKYQNSGTLPWQFNEPYPMATCTSAVDYYGQAKPSYYAVARAYEPVHVSARFPTMAWHGWTAFEAEVWINNSLHTPLPTGHVTARLVGISGQVCGAWEAAVAFQPNSAWAALTLQMPMDAVQDAVFFLDLVLRDGDDRVLSQNRCPFSKTGDLAPLLSVQSTALQVDRDVQGDTWALTLTNTGGTTALVVWIEDSRPVGAPGYAYFDDNHISLFPGEARRLDVTWHNVPTPARALTISGWNVVVPTLFNLKH